MWYLRMHTPGQIPRIWVDTKSGKMYYPTMRDAFAAAEYLGVVFPYSVFTVECTNDD